MPRSVTSPAWATWTKPIATNTRSAGSVNSVPGISCICQPFGPGTQATVQACSSVTRPPVPVRALVNVLQRRWQPSSWDDDVRMIFGQNGQGVSGLWPSGG